MIKLFEDRATILYRNKEFRCKYMSGVYTLNENIFQSTDAVFDETLNKCMLDIKKNLVLYEATFQDMIRQEEENIPIEIVLQATIVQKRCIISIENKQCYVNYYVIFMDTSGYSFSCDFQTKPYETYDIIKFSQYIQNRLSFGRVKKTIKPINVKYLPNMCMLSEEATGMLIHEIIGHLSEGYNPKEYWRKGKQLFHEDFTVVDDPTIPNFVGSFEFDDEGIKSQKKYLVKNGIIQDGLYSSFESDNHLFWGNARCENYRYRPKARMSNTYLESNNLCDDLKMRSELGEYVYIYQFNRGGFQYDNDHFSLLGNALLYRDSEIALDIGSIYIEENILEFVDKIESIGNKKEFASSCWCIKNKAIPIAVKYGGPMIKIKNMNIYVIKE